MVDLIASTTHAIAHLHVLAEVPDPGQGEPPPGAQQLEKLLQWVAWVVFGLCVAGILIVAGRMAISHRRGEGGEHATGLAWVASACIIAGSASVIVGTLVSGK
ncbi:hypothetical protein BTM25_01320 [Actinomadura rubteroloni]|uniref:Uncharacterized protein n=1 Tax=Actinomadura rubteroloni TaxID=1926885 RepID=A0A2P4UL84_9ACTN|nr:hypothetical protein [Actinomadura rubteroloni]POM25749.1 hypothetical protein BTM25_01320 [Actinomadura rubteroloni]